MRALVVALTLALSACVERVEDVHYGFDYSTHSADGERICSTVCLYRLDELGGIDTEQAGVHVYGFLIRRGDELYLAEASDGVGVSVPIDSVRPEVEDWMLEAMEGYFASVRGHYDTDTGGIDVFLLRRPNLPGVPRPELPSPDER